MIKIHCHRYCMAVLQNITLGDGKDGLIIRK